MAGRFASHDSCPLEVVAAFALQFNALEAGEAILTAYDQFLTILGDADKRARLEKLGVDNAVGDAVFQESREIDSQSGSLVGAHRCDRRAGRAPHRAVGAVVAAERSDRNLSPMLLHGSRWNGDVRAPDAGQDRDWRWHPAVSPPSAI
jgi:hypothetical protein